MASEINIWYWEVRFFRPLQEEEYRVWVNPAGRIAGYDHKVAEASPGATLARAPAAAKAQKFLVAQYQASLSDWEVLAGARGVGARLQTSAFDEHLLQPSRFDSLHPSARCRTLGGNSADAARADAVERRHQARRVCGSGLVFDGA